jgi:ABC transport system ATP-binding/permease protein
MAPPLLTLSGIDLTFGGTPLLTGADLMVQSRERTCLVGRNGSGKSTLLKIAAGLVQPDAGERFLQPGTKVAYLGQEADLSGFKTVADYVRAGLGTEDTDHMSESFLSDLGLTGDENTATLSGGERRRAALARALASQPDILLLDEPTNHLDLPAIEWLESWLAATSAAIIVISHDRRFLETVANETVWLDRGQTRRLKQGFAAFEDWRDTVLAEEELEQHKLKRKLVRETQWLHGGVSGRRKRNVRRLAELKQLRSDLKTHRGQTGTVGLESFSGNQSGRKVLEAKDISKAFGDTPIVRDLSLKVQRGDRIGIVGPNGAGKTTLLALLTGTLSPDSGTITHGANLELVRLEQNRDSLDPDMTLADALTGGGSDQVVVNGKARHVTAYMQDFLFLPEQRNTAVSALSGGERARVMLARALASQSNVLVLDEPTNDLDLETLDLLQDVLSDYEGTLLLVSHDRDFLDRIVTSVLGYEGNGTWRHYIGGYSDMMAERKRTAAGVKPAKKATAKSGRNNAPAKAEPQQKRKLSYKEKHTLETLPKIIEALESEAENLRETLADPDLFQRDPDAFAKASTALASKEQELAEAETRWLELEVLRESLEG